MTENQFGRYRIIKELGRGGMAVVYHAQDPQLNNRDLAIKVISSSYVSDETFRRRFQREAQAIALLDHPAIVPIYDLGEHNGQPYLVMRYMAGGTLANRLQKQGRMPWEEVLDNLERIAEALDHAHQHGIIHRDIKPANMLFDQFGKIYLADFGITRLAQSDTAGMTRGSIGTPQYMPPEVWEGLPALGAADQYSLACVAYEMLTGEMLFGGSSQPEIITKHLIHGPQFPPQWSADDIPSSTEFVLRRALQRDPAARYPSVGAFITALRELTTGMSLERGHATLAEAGTLVEVPTPAGGQFGSGAANATPAWTGRSQPGTRAATAAPASPVSSAPVSSVGTVGAAAVGGNTPAAAPPAPQAPQPPKRGRNWAMLVLGGLGGLVVCAGLAFGGMVLVNNWQRTVTVETATAASVTVPSSVTVVQPATQTAVATAVVLTDTPLSYPSPTVAALQVEHFPISLTAIANQSVTDLLPNFPTGNQIFNDVSFNIEPLSKVSTQCRATPDETIDNGTNPETISITIGRKVDAVHLLLNAGFTTAEMDGQIIGMVRLIAFNKETVIEVPLILGENIREWGINSANVANQLRAESALVREAYRGPNRFGDDSVIDMLTILVPAAQRDLVIARLEIADLSQTLSGSPDPCIFTVGITVDFLK